MNESIPSNVFDDATAFARWFLLIQNKHKQTVPLRHNKSQAHYLANRTNRDLILKARQLGFSTAIQGELFRAVVTSSASTLTLAHVNSTTQALRRMANGFYYGIPEQIRPRRDYDNSTIATYPDFKSEAMIATAGSRNTGRGVTTTHIHGSEVAFWSDADAILKGALQSLSPSGYVVLESTPNGASGWFYEQCMKAIDGDSSWRLHFYTWFDHDEYTLDIEQPLSLDDTESALVARHNLTHGQIAWRRQKIHEIGLTAFTQEYPEDAHSCFLTSGNNVFGDINHVLYKSTLTAPIDGHVYVAGIDWGQNNDYTVISIMDTNTMQEVALARYRQERWQDMRRQMINLCKQWNVSTIMAEKNSASSNIENLVDEVQALGYLMDVRPFTMTNPRKGHIVGLMREAIDKQAIQLLDIEWANAELRAYQSAQSASGLWTYNAPEGMHDDGCISRMLALFACSRA